MPYAKLNTYQAGTQQLMNTSDLAIFCQSESSNMRHVKAGYARWQMASPVQRCTEGPCCIGCSNLKPATQMVFYVATPWKTLGTYKGFNDLVRGVKALV